MTKLKIQPNFSLKLRLRQIPLQKVRMRAKMSQRLLLLRRFQKLWKKCRSLKKKPLNGPCKFL